jgi:hypothetical protein
VRRYLYTVFPNGFYNIFSNVTISIVLPLDIVAKLEIEENVFAHNGDAFSTIGCRPQVSCYFPSS